MRIGLPDGNLIMDNEKKICGNPPNQCHPCAIKKTKTITKTKTAYRTATHKS
jgi:hypothetical protein